MNFEYKPILEPLKVFFINPLAPASQLAIVKIMSGSVFGNDQSIDLTLVVYPNEIKPAEAFGLEIESCAFSCTDSIKIGTLKSASYLLRTVPKPSYLFKFVCCDRNIVPLSVSDGDVFCLISNFKNPNSFQFNKESLEEEFDALYLTMKLANSLRWTDNKESTISEPVERTHNEKDIDKKNVAKPIIITDGLVPTDIIKTLSTNIPCDIFFYPASITSIAKSVLGDYLNVPCKAINEIHVWAANDAVFHIEVDRPLIIGVTADSNSQFNLDSTQISDSWLKKEFIKKKIDIITNSCKKVVSSSSKNPYGCIYKAVEFTKTLRDIWRTRAQDDCKKVFRNIGCISDGSLGTIKGYPYILPVVFESQGFWTVNNIFEDSTHLKQEIKRMNKTVQEYHEKLIPYCKKFLPENITNCSLSEDNNGTAHL